MCKKNYESSKLCPTYNHVVRSYIDKHRLKIVADLKFYASQPTMIRSIEVSAMAMRRPDCKRHSHQCRIPKNALLNWKTRLLRESNRLKSMGSFDELYQLISDCSSNPTIPWIGELTVYDTALRIGAFLKLYPKHIYLHRGARKGALALGLNCDRSPISVKEVKKISSPFGKLEPYEIEDCLCIYKTDLTRIKKIKQ